MTDEIPEPKATRLEATVELDRFQTFAADLAEKAGAWPHFAFWLVLLAIWIALGPLLHWSDSWQLIANTPTTWYELFLGLAILVDGARQIMMLERMLRHQAEQQDRIERIEEAILGKTQTIEQEEQRAISVEEQILTLDKSLNERHDRLAEQMQFLASAWSQFATMQVVEQSKRER